MTRPQNAKCPDGCTCGKHRKRICEPGCRCSRHSAQRRPRTCLRGCTCGRHRVQRCAPGCTCDRHAAQVQRKYTDDQRAEALRIKRIKGREYAFQRRVRMTPEERRAEDAKRNGAAARRGWYLKSRFGITADQWNTMLIEQDGCCYLCADPLDPKHIHVDHSHACCPGDRSCGVCVRGLACRWCNQGVGQFRDDPDRMMRAAIALEVAEAKIRAALARTRIARE